MVRRRVGTILVGIGTTLLVVAGIGTFVPGNDDSGAVASPNPLVTTTSAAPTTTAPAASATTTSTSTTTTAAPTTTTTAAPTTTTAAPTTTTTLAPDAVITAFIGEFSAAIASADTDWLFDRLHSAMTLGYGEDLCRGFIDREILELTQYELTGVVSGPVTKTLPTGVGDVTVDGIYEAEVSFVFKGSSFDVRADFVLEDQVSWLAICR